MSKIKIEKPTNECLLEKYLEHYQHSPQSVNMRRSSLNYFFGEKTNKCFGYQGHIFDLDTSILIDYFTWLKNLDLVSIETRKNKWRILTSLLQFSMEYWNGKRKGEIRKLKQQNIKEPEKYVWEKFIVKIPSKTISWKNAIQKKKGKGRESNADVYANKEEIQQLLQYFKNYNFKHYLIFRIFTDTGMRRNTLINLRINEVYLEERYFHPKISKTDEKFYPFPEELQKFLKIYLNNRKEQKAKTNVLFLNKYEQKYGLRAFNLILARARKSIGIKKKITTKTFRKTLNSLRKKIECPLEDRKMLLGHKLNDVNVKNYTPTDIKLHIKAYDKWYPYENLNI